MILSKTGCSFAEAQPQWCSLKSISLPQLILDVPLVREVDQAGVVDEEDKGGRIYPSLSGIIELQALSPLGGRGVVSYGLHHDAVQL